MKHDRRVPKVLARALILILLASIGDAASAAPDIALAPGLYRLEPGSEVSAAEKIVLPADEQATERFDHAIPASAKIVYALVSASTASPRTMVAFVGDPGYSWDAESPTQRFCRAYAFPDWNDESSPARLCRSNIGYGAYELRIATTAGSMTIRFATEKTFLRSTFIEPQHKPTEYEIGGCVLGVCSTAAYGYTINHYAIRHFTDRFVLQTARPYRGLLYLPQAVPGYASADRASPKGDIAPQTYVAILTTTPEWHEVEQVSIDGTAARYWVNRDDVDAIRWVEQSAATPALRFRVAFARDPQDPAAEVSEGAIPLAVEVLDRATGTRVQVLRDFYAEVAVPLDHAIDLVDANFDGNPDITMAASSGGAGPNNGTNVFLFDPAQRRFVYDETLSDLTQLSIDAKTRTITSDARDGCCSHASDTYRYINGVLTLVASWEERLTADGAWVETTIGRLDKGKMRLRTRRTKASPE